MERLMIKDFNQVRAQLMELADVINSFKSEAVQLKIVELIFSDAREGNRDAGAEEGFGVRTGKSRRQRKQGKRPGGNAAPGNIEASSEPSKPSASANRGRMGGRATLSALVGSGFFNTPRTLGAIISHCDTNRATKFKPSDFSGTLARLTRNDVLKRKKNADNQYEYVKA
jgi:hypothetical protein